MPPLIRRLASGGLAGSILALALLGVAALADAQDPRARGVAAIRSLTGCFLVDYSFVEVEALRPGYVRDPRVYDVNRDKSVKEWISAEEIGPGRIRLPRILFLPGRA